MSPADDPRWQSLLAADALADIRFDAPDAWPHGPRSADQKTLEVGDDSLSAAYCTLAGHRFLRTRMALPIQGAREVLGFETWASVSEDSWAAILAARTGGVDFPGGFAWLTNAIPGFDTPEPVGCNILPGRPGQMPRLFPQSGPLHGAQQTGLSLDALIRVLAAAGRDLPKTTT